MRKSILLLTSAAVSLMLAFSACSSSDGKPVEAPPVVASVTLNKSELKLALGRTETLTPTVSPAEAPDRAVAWQSSDTDVAEVSFSGAITAKSTGKATVTVTTLVGNRTASCEVTVIPVPVSSVVLNETAITLFPGGRHLLTATVLPQDAANKNVTWYSSNTAVTVSNGLVTAYSDWWSSAVITVTTEDGGKTDTCFVTLTSAPPPSTTITDVMLNKNAIYLIPGATSALSATVLPAAAPNKAVVWSSSDNNIATVTQDGLVTAIAPGAANITASSAEGNKTATCAVTVQPKPVAGDVFVAGFVYNEFGIPNATLWRNGEIYHQIVENDSVFNSVYVFEGDLYVCGHESYDPKLWKNCEGLILETASNKVLTSVFVYEGDVYCSGNTWNENGNQVATVWKNGRAASLSDGLSESRAFSVFVSDGDVYVAGYENRIPFGTGADAIIWKNGEPIILSEELIEAHSMSVFVSGGDVYAAGEGWVDYYDDDYGPVVVLTAMYWKNGETIILKEVKDPNYIAARGGFVFVQGDDVYVAGTDKGYMDDEDGYQYNAAIVTVWKNGETIRLSDDFIVDTNVESLFVTADGDVYVAGTQKKTNYVVDNTCATLWKNGETIRLSDGSTDAAAYSVFVVE
ncbi:MAG: Ig-like domain-containing protein [Holophagales bacterium]|jgi:uncharacterized protein YjdB|nr:Ig-like domain-containing protein [Holophagales bacterium]